MKSPLQYSIERGESLRDQIATIIQDCYTHRETSTETADRIVVLIMAPEKEAK